MFFFFSPKEALSASRLKINRMLTKEDNPARLFRFFFRNRQRVDEKGSVREYHIDVEYKKVRFGEGVARHLQITSGGLIPDRWPSKRYLDSIFDRGFTRRIDSSSAVRFCLQTGSQADESKKGQLCREENRRKLSRLAD